MTTWGSEVRVLYRASVVLALFLYSLCFADISSIDVDLIFDSGTKERITIYKTDKEYYIPLNKVAKICHGKLSWVLSNKTAFLSMRNHRISFTPNSRRITIDGEILFLESLPRIFENRLLIPLKFLMSERFSEVSEISFRFVPGSLFVSKRSNLCICREKSRISFLMREKLKYDVLSSSDRIRLVFFDANVAEADLSEDSFIKDIVVKKFHRKIDFTINLKEGVTAEFIREPLKLIISLSKRELRKIVTQPKQVGKVVIVIDPGHGGKDPGAIGKKGTKEKDLNLQISLKLAETLKKKGYVVYLTREDDIFLPLAERTNFANERKADLFVSIHCNASYKKEANGFEVYFLSENASDLDAEETAELENKAIEYEEDLSSDQKMLRAVLWSMTKNVFLNESSEICGLIHKEVKGNGISTNGVKQADFYVLRGAQMPAVLVECGYISFPKEELLLRKKKFQKVLVKSISEGIDVFFAKKVKE